MTYMDFIETLSPSFKTRTWDVRNSKSGDLLARVKWHGAWRQYVIVAESGTIFNKGCLQEICSFLDMQMEAWRREGMVGTT